jgi:transposase InsO family protein
MTLSRLAYVRALPNERGDTAAGFLHDAEVFFRRNGVRVEGILTDRGSAYVSRAFRAAITELDLRHKLT